MAWGVAVMSDLSRRAFLGTSLAAIALLALGACTSAAPTGSADGQSATRVAKDRAAATDLARIFHTDE